MFTETGRRAGWVRVGGEGEAGQGDGAALRGDVFEEAAVFKAAAIRRDRRRC